MEFTLKSVGVVEASRNKVEDDFWGGSESIIRLQDWIEDEALVGLAEFSHVEIIFLMDRVEEMKVSTGLRRPRGNPDWPMVGIFAQRAKFRPNRLGATICRVLEVKGRTLRVSELDAVDGTPVLDIKPVLREFLPRGETRQPNWTTELMENYWSGPR